MDRGYSSRWLVAAGNARGIAFCMRVDKAGFACVRDFLRSGDDERIVTPIQGDDHEESEVIYRYKLSNIADLARNPQVEEAFPVVRRTVDGEHTQKEELYVKLTPQGEALGLND
jgi:hypothetical protein